MRYTIELSNRFKKRYKKLNPQQKQIFQVIVNRLANDEDLEIKYRDHALKGNYIGFRECHLMPDLLLIYKKQGDKLILYCLDIGTHSDLF